MAQDVYPVRVVAAVLARSDGRVFVAQRAYGTYAGTWEFPGGKAEPGEGHVETMDRELVEEGVIQTADHLTDVCGTPCFEATLLLNGCPVQIRHYNCRAAQVNLVPPAVNAAHTRFAWNTWEELRALPVNLVSPGMAAILASCPHAPRSAL